MIQSRHISSQRIAVVVAKNGSIKTTLVVETNLNPPGPDFDELVGEIVRYLKTHDELDNAEINCIATCS